MTAKKPTIECQFCFARIDYVEVIEERHGIMSIGGEIEYDLNSKNNGAPRYLCPRCQEELDESKLLKPRPSTAECAQKERANMGQSGCQ